MSNPKLSLPALSALSYAWNKSDLDKEFCFVKLAKSVKAFVSGLFCGKIVTKSDVANVCNKRPNSFLGKKYTKISCRNVHEKNVRQMNLLISCVQENFQTIFILWITIIFQYVVDGK